MVNELKIIVEHEPRERALTVNYPKLGTFVINPFSPTEKDSFVNITYEMDGKTQTVVAPVKIWELIKECMRSWGFSNPNYNIDLMEKINITDKGDYICPTK